VRGKDKGERDNKPDGSIVGNGDKCVTGIIQMLRKRSLGKEMTSRFADLNNISHDQAVPEQARPIMRWRKGSEEQQE
jgi:hypothetical protein